MNEIKQIYNRLLNSEEAWLAVIITLIGISVFMAGSALIKEWTR